MSFRIRECGRLHEQRLESSEDLSGQDFEATFGVVAGVGGVDGVDDALNAREPHSTEQALHLETQAKDMGLGLFDGFP